jgi:U4/U6 small nuclear ribonucleoprotein PRP4
MTQLVGHTYQVFDADFHPSVATNDPDMPNIATAGADSILRLWTFDPENSEQDCLELGGHEDRINRVKFHPNGLHVVSASYDKTAKVWDIEKEKAMLTLKGHQASIHAMSLHPDGSLVVGDSY